MARYPPWQQSSKVKNLYLCIDIAYFICYIYEYTYISKTAGRDTQMGYNPVLYQLKAELCKTFSEPKRLIIIDALRDGERSVGDLARIMEIDQAIVSRHLGILRERGVVKTRRDGTSIYYSLSDPKICEACDIVQEILLNQVKKSGELAKKLVV